MGTESCSEQWRKQRNMKVAMAMYAFTRAATYMRDYSACKYKIICCFGWLVTAYIGCRMRLGIIFMATAGPDICLFLLCFLFEESEKTLSIFLHFFLSTDPDSHSWVIVKQTLQCLGRSRIGVSLTEHQHQQNTSKVKNTSPIDRAPHRQTWHLSVLNWVHCDLGCEKETCGTYFAKKYCCVILLIQRCLGDKWLQLNLSWAQNWFWSHFCFQGSLQGLLPSPSCPCITSAQLSSFLLRAWKINLGLYASILHFFRVGYHKDFFFFPHLYSPQVARNLRRCVKTAYTYFTEFCVIYHHFSIYQNSNFPKSTWRIFCVSVATVFT